MKFRANITTHAIGPAQELHSRASQLQQQKLQPEKNHSSKIRDHSSIHEKHGPGKRSIQSLESRLITELSKTGIPKQRGSVTPAEEGPKIVHFRPLLSLK
jgi:hypothetical protein